MKIDIYSDFSCPYCVIAKKQLKEAMKFFEEDVIELNYKSFELDPEGEGEDGERAIDAQVHKYGITPEKARRNIASLDKYAARMDIEMHAGEAITSNTLPAHRLTKYALTQGKGEELLDALYRANFTENRLLADPEVLMELAKEVGLEEEKVSEVLNSEAYLEEVRADEREAKALEIELIPAFVFNGQLKMAGAQSVDKFVAAIKEELAKELTLPEA